MKKSPNKPQARNQRKQKTTKPATKKQQLPGRNAPTPTPRPGAVPTPTPRPDVTGGAPGGGVGADREAFIRSETQRTLDPRTPFPRPQQGPPAPPRGIPGPPQPDPAKHSSAARNSIRVTRAYPSQARSKGPRRRRGRRLSRPARTTPLSFPAFVHLFPARIIRAAGRGWTLVASPPIPGLRRPPVSGQRRQALPDRRLTGVRPVHRFMAGRRQSAAVDRQRLSGAVARSSMSTP